MPKTDRGNYQRAGAPAPAPTHPFSQTFRGRILLTFATVAMLSLSFAPIKQFYLAWVGLVPWLVLIANARTKKQTFLWSWLTGILLFAVNMWWTGYVTIPGGLGLFVYLGLWFPITALLYRGLRVLTVDNAKSHRTTLAIFAIAAVWVGQEWMRGNLFTGLPWLFLGHAQTPILVMCQVADLGSAYVVSFWVMLINAWVALLILRRLEFRSMIRPGAAVLAVLVGTLAYGLFRMSQDMLYAGPSVMVVQPNFPQDNSGSKGATYDQILDFHLCTTTAALEQLKSAKRAQPDLILWSETMMPELNDLGRQYRRNYELLDHRNMGEFCDQVHEQLAQLARTYQVNLLVGGHTMLPAGTLGGKPAWSMRNSAYLYDSKGIQSALRYDKIHLVPFGEFIPCKDSCPPLYAFFNIFNPYKDLNYTVDPGTDLTVFPLGQYRFVCAICFEDVDARLMSRMFAGPSGTKRADFMVNLTNDGWFATPQMQQHLQLAVFRCIENRAPIARAVNTGISGFIDPLGRAYDLMPVGTTGAMTSQLWLDHRVAPYTRIGDVFGIACVSVSGVLMLLAIGNGLKKRKSAGR